MTLRFDYPDPVLPRKRLLLVFPLLAALVSACVSAPDAPQAPTETLAEAAQSKRQIAFLDLDSFDRAMEQALRAGQDVEVLVSAPMSPNAIAPRLGKWLNTVQEYGGTVEVTGQPQTRSLALAASLAGLAYEAWKGMRYRRLVKGVDAQIELSQDQIRRVSFKRKTEANRS